MGVGTSFTLGPPRAPPHWCRGILRFGIIKAPTVIGAASTALGPLRLPLHWRGGILRFGIIEAPA